MVTVKSVEENSPAKRCGVMAGDVIISINSHEIRDVLDYDFYTAEKKLEILVHRGPELLTLKAKKDEYQPLGCEFATYLMDEKQSCRNKCVFCFIDQNPKGMRETVYFKDDDSRMSFLSGNYVTLTNMDEREVERIIEMHISPINISVHTTNPELRVKMMNNKNAGKCLSIMDRFAEAGIWMNAQIVLCPQINDGKELVRTLSDLEKYLPALQSVAVVPVGLTKHREGLCPLRGFTKEEAAAVIDTVDSFGDRLLKSEGMRVCYPSDEFYLTAERQIPEEDYYDGFPQLDNGVGLIRSLSADVEYALEDVTPSDKNESFTIVTGYAAYGTVKELARRIADAVGYKGRYSVHKIRNDFFGESVTVAGLVTGGDIIAQLSGKELGEFLYVPCVMLRYEQDRFLDDVTVEELERALGVKVRITGTDSESFIKIFTSR